MDRIHTECLRAVRSVRVAFQGARNRAAAWEPREVPSGWRGVRPSLLAYRQAELEQIDEVLGES